MAFAIPKNFPLPPRRRRATFPPFADGVLAQLVERLNGIQEVRGSNPLGSTILRSEQRQWCRAEDGALGSCFGRRRASMFSGSELRMAGIFSLSTSPARC